MLCFGSGGRLVFQTPGIDRFGQLVVLCLVILAVSDHLDFPLLHQVRQTDTAEELMNLVTQVRPQVMGQTHFTVLAVPFVTAPGAVQGFVDGIYHISDEDLITGTAEPVTTARTSHASDQLFLSQTGKQLLKVRKGDSLTSGNICQTDRTFMTMKRQVQHRSHGVAAFGCQSHNDSPRLKVDGIPAGEYVLTLHFGQVFTALLPSPPLLPPHCPALPDRLHSQTRRYPAVAVCRSLRTPGSPSARPYTFFRYGRQPRAYGPAGCAWIEPPGQAFLQSPRRHRNPSASPYLCDVRPGLFFSQPPVPGCPPPWLR